MTTDRPIRDRPGRDHHRRLPRARPRARHGLARRGTRLVIDARGAEALEAARRSLAEHTEVIAVAGSITDPDHRQALIAAATSLGGLDLLINNAGVLGPSPLPPLATYPLDAYREVLEVGAVAPLGAGPARPAAAAALGRRGDQRDQRRRRRGVRGMGRVRIGEGRAGAVVPHPRRRGDPASACGGPTRATCARRCTRQAFPGEDISDRPLPETAVPGFLRLLDARPASGRVRIARRRQSAGRGSESAIDRGVRVSATSRSPTRRSRAGRSTSSCRPSSRRPSRRRRAG